MRTRILPSLSGLFLGAMLAAVTVAAPARAQLNFSVSLNTASLVGNAAGPFTIDFQLTDGSGTDDANNSVTISNFAFGGGGAVGTSSLLGGAAGSLSAGVSLTDSSFLNEFDQVFTPGSLLSFDVSMTTNVDAGLTPDEFSFAILDSTGSEIPTFDTVGDAFLTVDIDSVNPPVVVYASDPSRPLAATPTAPGVTTGIPNVTFAGPTQAPEPGTLPLLAAAGATAFAVVRRRRF